MKLLRKRIVAVICIVAMLGGVVFQGGFSLDSKAADTAAASTATEADPSVREWYVYGDDTEDTGLVVADTANGVTANSISDAGVNLPDGLIEANMELHINLTVEGTDLSTLNSSGACFELSNELNDCAELSWVYQSFVSGENNISFAFKDAAHTNGSVVNGKGVQDNKSPFDWQETINYFRSYQQGSPSDIKITVNEIKIVYTEAGLTFGADDTYLQLDSAMSATPNAVEATINMDEIDNRVKWTLHSGSTFSGVSMTVGSYTTTGNDTPGAGMECFTLDASSAEIAGFEALQHSLAIDASAYTTDELSLGFWVYSSTAGKLAPDYDYGQIRLSSNADNMSGNCLFYYMCEISVNAGWNYIEIPLSSMKKDIIGDFTLSNINVWGITSNTIPQGTVRHYGDFELIVTKSEDSSEDNTDSSWTLRSGSDTSIWENGSGHTLTTGTTVAGDAPGAGMNYMVLDATTTAVSGFSTRNTGLGIDVSAYELSELAVAFWVYADKAGALGAGDQLRIGSGDYLGSDALIYSYANISLEAGWNYVELPLDKWATDIKGNFSLSNIKTFGLAGYQLAQGNVRYFGDFNLIVITPSGVETTVNEGDIVVTKNIASVTDNYMIFSNANAEGETNPFAMYVTPDGYLGVLYGTTQFVLKQSVSTGANVKVKAVINASKQVEFYVDGSLVATSKTTVSSLGAPQTAYSIGADGAGAQTFAGTIKDVKVYSDAAATTCIGNWPLVGDVNYVVETMPDVSGNGYDANFKGTRANEWYDVEAIGEDDWSLVFIPDIVQRFYAGEHATWHKMAKWIGDNVEAENIQYVIGAKTADSAQADAMNYGYEFFNNRVASTNFNTADENSYYRFQVNGVKWMVLSLKKGWDADATAVFTWGKELIAKYPNDNIIITCDHYYNSIWSELGSSNVKLVVYGSGVEPTTDVPAMNFPAQNDLETNYFGEQGLGLMYMLRFTEGGTKVTARSYAPIYNSYFTGVVNYEKTIDTVKAPEAITVKYDGATPGTAPTDVPEGYLFAGWFTPSGIAKEWTLHSGTSFSGVSMGVGSYTTTSSDEPGEGMTCFTLNESSTASANFEAKQTYLGIDASSYELNELALSFWVYSNTAGPLDDPNDKNWAHIRIGSDDEYANTNCLFYYLQDINVEAGWNYFEIPLSSFKDDIVADFTLSNINTWTITSYKVPTGMELKFGDFKLVAYGADCSVGSALKEATTEKVYARFVDEDLLTVKGQIKDSTSDKSNYSDIRFVTSVDRLEYKRVGFKISYLKDDGSTKKLDIESKYVYETLYAVGAGGGEAEEYKPSQVTAASAQFFKAYTVSNVPNRAFDRDFTVQAYWKTLDGTMVYGEEVSKNIWMGYPTNEEFLPMIVSTTYETDDVVIADVVLNDPKYGYVTAADVANTAYDWSTALQNALTDVHNKGGGTVYVPAGQYKLSKSILVPSDVTLRGDWQDPDVGTAYGTIFNIYPTQELTGANRNADSVHNADTNGDGYSDVAAFVMAGSSGVVGVTVYYPEQSLSDVKEYPYTFYVTVGNDGGQLITLKNITVINGYRGIGTRYEKQHEALIVDNFKGTFLDCGMAIYNSSDTGSISNVSISSKYWEESSLGVAEAGTYVLANATAMELGDLEWHQLSNCAVDGYNVGISIVGGYRTNFAGSMIDMSITGCTTGLTIAAGNDTTYYAGSDVDGKDAYPLNRALDPRWGLVIARSTISATGNAIVNNTKPTIEEGVLGNLTQKIGQTSALVRLTDVTVTGTIVENNYQDASYGSSISDSEKNVRESSEDLGDSSDVQYDATYSITNAQKKNLWVVELQNYSADEIENNMHEIINTESQKLLSRNADGGILYIPGGIYKLYGTVTVPAGVELHGASSVANREQYIDGEGTLFMVYYGDDDTNTTTDTALVTLAGDNSGISGIRFLYPENISTSADDASSQTFSSTYTIAAKNASNVHVTNCFVATSSYGVNLQSCDDFHVENLFTCVYRNTINVEDGTGIIRNAWTNPNAIARTTAEGLPDTWPEEAKYDNSTAPINVIRNYLKDTLTFIQVSGSESDVLIHNVTAYAHNKSVSQSGGNVLVINSNADSLDHENGVQFELTGGTLKVINALRAAVTDTGSSQDTAEKFLYSHSAGTIAIYNSIMAKSTEANSAWEDNTNETK